MQVDFVRALIKEHFGAEVVPFRKTLVAFDGFDQLEKEAADAFFRGMRWSEMVTYLREIEASLTRGGAFMLEEWSVLETDPLAYYARAYLEYFVDALEREEPNLDFLASFFGALYQLVYMGRYHLLGQPQRETLAMIAHLIADDWRDSSCQDRQCVSTSAQHFLAELESRGGLYNERAQGGIA
jgi:hypothetical protein